MKDVFSVGSFFVGFVAAIFTVMFFISEGCTPVVSRGAMVTLLALVLARISD
jgi:hypothetical protein